MCHIAPTKTWHLLAQEDQPQTEMFFHVLCHCSHCPFLPAGLRLWAPYKESGRNPIGLFRLAMQNLSKTKEAVKLLKKLRAYNDVKRQEGYVRER